MAYAIVNHRLQQDGGPVAFVATPNQGGVVKPLYLLMHYTAGTTASGAINHLKNASAKASAHLVIDRNGSITQMVPFNRVAWHAGASSWGELQGMNQFSIGIELVNAGKLKRRADGKWVNWADNVIPDSQVMELTHKNESQPAGWHVFPAAQLEVAADVGIALREKYGFVGVLGHDDVAPTRKVDPGPAFPMISFESKVMGRM